MKATAAVVREPGGSMVLTEVDVPEPRGTEVLVRVGASGVCHTDALVAEGSLPFPFPAVLGHEGAGIVEAVGEQARAVRPGQRVLLMSPSCGHCRKCTTGRPAMCTEVALRWGGSRVDGSPALRDEVGPISGRMLGQSSFATVVNVEERTVLPVDTDIPDTTLAPFGCGVVTGAGAVLNVLRPEAGSTVVVLGVGAVGLSAVMAAALSGAGQIIAVDRVVSRLALARELGATAVIDTTEHVDLASAVRDLDAQGADAVVDTTARAEVIEAATGFMARGAVMGLIGAPLSPTTIELAIVDLVRNGTGIKGVVMGETTPHFLRGLIAQHERNLFPVDRLVKSYPFEHLEQAIADSASGEVVKPVITFG